MDLILKVESLLENKQLKYTYSIQLSLSGGYKKLKDYVQDIVEKLVLDTFSKKKVAYIEINILYFYAVCFYYIFKRLITIKNIFHHL